MGRVEETEDGGYYPEAMGIADGEAIIFDAIEFEEKYNADAVILKDGQLFVLDKATRKWASVEPEKPPQKKFRSVD